MKIRIAKKEDIQSINQLNGKLFDNEIDNFDKALDKTWVKREGNWPLVLSSNGIVFVAEEDDKIIGYLAGDIKNSASYRKKMKISELESFFVLENHRNQGIGQKLIQSFINWSEGKRAKKISVTASFANESVIRFYKRNGFKEYDLILEKDLRQKKQN